MSKQGKNNWKPLESNPEAINKFLRKIGVPDPVQCVDVLGFDDELLAMIPKPVYAIILCFPNYNKVRELMAPVYDKLKKEGGAVPSNIFFMEQKISNACGTFALFHALANNSDRLDIGNGSLKRWLDNAGKLDSAERSNALADDQELAVAHLDCADDGDTNAPEHVDNHFISFVHKNDRLYELDSAASIPRDCGPTNEENFLKDASRQCQELMNKLSSISFSAMALVGGDA